MVSNNAPVLMSWRQHANCKNIPTNDFFPVEITKNNRKEVNKIISICRNCPVSAQCVLEAIVNDYDGIWGGTTMYQRYSYIRYLNANGITEISLTHAQQFIDDISGNTVVGYPKKGSKRKPKISINYSDK